MSIARDKYINRMFEKATNGSVTNAAELLQQGGAKALKRALELAENDMPRSVSRGQKSLSTHPDTRIAQAIQQAINGPDSFFGMVMVRKALDQVSINQVLELLDNAYSAGITTEEVIELLRMSGYEATLQAMNTLRSIRPNAKAITGRDSFFGGVCNG